MVIADGSDILTLLDLLFFAQMDDSRLELG